MRPIIKLLLFLFFAQQAWGQDGFIGKSPALAYWTVGNKEEVVIVLHGGPGAGHQYLRPEWDALTKVARVVYYDQRGCGKSEKADCYTWEEHVEDLKRVITSFSKGRKVILAGSSWGTILALLYAYTYPQDIKAIILSGTVAWPGQGTALKDCSFYKPDYHKYLALGLDTTLQYTSMKYNYTIKAPQVPDSAFFRKVKEDKLYASPFFERVATLNSLKDAPTLSALQKIEVPILIFHSSGKCDEKHSFLKDASEQYSILPKVEVFSIDGACHDPWFTNPKTFFAKCIDFLNKLN